MKQVTNVRFVTETGIEVPAISSAEMRDVDRIAMEETGPNLYQMMENAGRNRALLALEVLGGAWHERKVVVLAGAGGNGGGGICAARHLANHGADVRLYLAVPERLGEVPSFQRKIFQSTSGGELETRELAKSGPGLILDALIGYGLRAAPEGPVADAIQWANASGAPILALDVPSGVNADDGGTPGVFIRPRWTMTLALPKTWLLPERTGKLFLADIGIPEGTYRRIGLNPQEDPDRGMLGVANRAPQTDWQFPAKDIVDAGFLELVRYGIRRPDDPVIFDSLRVVDAVLKVDTPFGPCWRRYNHDGYGQRDNGEGMPCGAVAAPGRC